MEFPCVMRRMCLPLCLCGVLAKRQFDTVGWWHSVLSVYQFYRWLGEVPKSPDVILDFFYFSFQFSQFLLPCVFEALLWDVYTLRIVMSSWHINHFLIMEWPSLSPLVFFVLKFTLLNINGAMLAFLTISVRMAYLCFPPGEWQFSPSFVCRVVLDYILNILNVLLWGSTSCSNPVLNVDMFVLADIDLAGFRVCVPNGLLRVVVLVSVLCS